MGKKNDENVQQNTPRTQVAFSEGQGADTRAVAYRPEQNMRMSFNEARADQNDHGETALQTFWKRNMSSNKSKSTSGTSAATPVASIQHPSSRTATAGALIRRPEPLSARHVQVRPHLLFTLLHAAPLLVAYLSITRLHQCCVTMRHD